MFVPNQDPRYPFDYIQQGVNALYPQQIASQLPTPAAPVPTPISPFSPQTQAAHTMIGTYAQSNTPQLIQGIAGDVGGYRGAAAAGLNPESALNQTINTGIANMGQYTNRGGPQFAAYAPLTSQGVSAQSIQAAQMAATPGMSAAQMAAMPGMTAAQMGRTAGVEAAQVAGVNDIRARQGADYMNTYMNPYLNQVVDTSLSDYDVGVDRQAAQNRARRDASSAFGDRAAIADAVFSADSNRGRASTASNLRSQAFNTSAAFGMQDSDRFLDADRTNQQVALQRAMENARMQQAAAEANARMEFERGQTNTRLEQDTREGNTSREFTRNQSNTQLEQATREGNISREFNRNQSNTSLEQASRLANAGYAQDASFRNADIANDFTTANEQRRLDLEQRNFDSSMRNDQFNLNAIGAQIGAAQNQQNNQAGIASTLTGIAGQQSGIYGNADQAQVSRINALSSAGQQIDDRNQRINDEYTKMLQAQQAAAQQPKKKKKGLFSKIKKGLNIARAFGVPIPPIP
jgi:hypothetical protein